MFGCILASLENESRRLPLGKHRMAFVFDSISRNRLLANVVSWSGAVLIFTAAFFCKQIHTLSAVWLLLPTTGTALLIAAGRQSFFNRIFLSNKLLVGVGLISYPLYLWHWPLLSFARIVSHGKPSELAIASMITTSVVLAWLTYRYVECPIRFGKTTGAMKVLQLSACLTGKEPWSWTLPIPSRRVLQLCACMTGILLVVFMMRLRIIPSRISVSPLGKQIEIAGKDWAYHVDNHRRSSGFIKDTEKGPTNTGPAVLFIGDSHMQQYWPRIELLLTNTQRMAHPVILITAGGSPTLPNVNRTEAGYACDRFFEFALEEAGKTNVGTVGFGCFWELYFIGAFPGFNAGQNDIYRNSDPKRTPIRIGSPASDRVFAEFGQSIAGLVSMRKEVVVLSSSPSCQTWDPAWTSRLPFCSKLGANSSKITRQDFESFVHPVKKKLIEIVHANGGRVIDPLDYFEESGFLHGRTADLDFRFMDYGHMRPFYVRERATFLDALIQVQARN